MEIHLKLAEWLTELLENRFHIFGFKFGLDPILGIIPGLGDMISFALSFYLIWIAKRIKVPQKHISKMFSNVITDLIIGFIPLIGDLGDFVYKANTRNLAILKQYSRPKVIEGEIVT